MFTSALAISRSFATGVNGNNYTRSADGTVGSITLFSASTLTAISARSGLFSIWRFAAVRLRYVSLRFEFEIAALRFFQRQRFAARWLGCTAAKCRALTVTRHALGNTG